MNFLFNENPKNKKANKAIGKYIYIGRKKLLDISYASGSLLLGHTSNTYKKSLNKLRNIGSNYSLINNFAEKYSLIIKKVFPEFSKFILCASGTEANMKAIRIARAITSKKKVVMISGSWHGSVDELLYTGDGEKLGKKKYLSNGLSNNDKDTIVIPYNNFIGSKKILDKSKRKIALLIAEPIQQALPLPRAEAYIKSIVRYCRKNKIIICFDEMITGMRLPEFSVYKKINMPPDILTFGKILGGGAPIGVIGIKKKIEISLKKKNNYVFFGGTYSLNPISSYLGSNTIKYILKNRVKIYKKLDKLSEILANKLNEFIKEKNLDVSIIRYSSILRIIFTKKKVDNKLQKEIEEFKNIKKIKKFHEYVFKKNIFLSKNGAIFLSNKNTMKDINYISKVLKSGLKNF
jgi:glutamate-1-semialdehyde 2,1-aminomutase